MELGAAPGDEIVALARLGHRCAAVDVGVRYVVWNLEDGPSPLPDAAYDAVVLTREIVNVQP